MIDLSKEHLILVQKILKQHLPNFEVRAFGSRVQGKSRPYSDLDLVLMGKKALDWREIETLKNAFSESDLPMSVDVADWHTLSEEFRKIVSENSFLVQAAKD